MSNLSRRQIAFQARKAGGVPVSESPFKAGTKRLKKGWKYQDGVPVKVKDGGNGKT